MSKLQWDKAGERTYETGVSQCVLYVQEDGVYRNGVAWNGISSITDQTSGGEPTAFRADDQKYLNLYSRDEFNAAIEAYTYPEEFETCNGNRPVATGSYAAQQGRQFFGLCFKTIIGNDTDLEKYAYKLHVLYGLKVLPTESSYNSINDSPEAALFSWEIRSVPIRFPGFRDISEVVIDSRKVSAEALEELEACFYGTDDTEPMLLTPKQIKTIIDFDGSKLYSYVDPGYLGRVSIYPRTPRVQAYRYTDEYNDGNVLIENVGDKLYSYYDTDNDGDVVVEEEGA